MFICRVVLMVVLATSGAAMAQGTDGAGIDPTAGKGSVRNNVYTNPFFGFTYTIPKDWKVIRGPEQISKQGGCPKDQCVLLEVQSHTGTGRVEIKAVQLRPGGTAKEIVQKFAGQEETYGMKAAGPQGESQGGSLKLSRADYQSPDPSAPVFETLVVTTAKGNALLFTILSDSQNLRTELTSGITGTEEAK
ncbi:MAG TPA: hypothetical protein VG892_09000 [Terriglobales bacterium]|jgi:hypothetical protein|nr:hypothetical protein [Terriglobales bacterium]